MKNKKILIVAVVLLIVSVGCFVFMQNKGSSTDQNNSQPAAKKSRVSKSSKTSDGSVRVSVGEKEAAYKLQELKDGEVSSDEVTIPTPNIILKRAGEKAQIVDRVGKKVLWEPKDSVLTGIEVSRDGSMVLVHLASSSSNYGNSMVLSVPDFKKLVTLPVNSAHSRGRGIAWRWVGKSQLLGLCQIEKTKEELSKMTSLEQESDMAIEKTLIYTLDVSSKKFSRVDKSENLPDKFELSGIRQDQNLIQIVSQNPDKKEEVHWYRVIKK